MQARPHLNILGTRGIPAAHGGFETFAERLALYLTSRGVSVTVYCQSIANPTIPPTTRAARITGTVFTGCIFVPEGAV